MSIDFRVRPPIPSYSTAEFFRNFDDVTQRSARFGTRISPWAREFSLPGLIREMDEAGVSQAVVPIRKGCGGDNEDLLRLFAEWPGRFIGLAGLAPMQDMGRAMEELERFVLSGPCAGIALEPAFDPVPWQVDDERVFPLYERCQEAGVPVAFTYGGIFTPGLRYYQPLPMDRVAELFPRLRIALCHGGWPFVTEFCEIAFNRGNVWLAPDMYMIGAPGSQEYVLAANGILYDRMLFGSAAPIISIADAERAYRQCGVRAERLPFLMEGNARNFLGIEAAVPEDDAGETARA